MVVGLGTDICENARIERLYNKHKTRFLDRVYHATEVEYCFSKKNPFPYLGSRFALKEAVIKALNITVRNPGLAYYDIYIKGHGGKKQICLDGEVKKIYIDQNITNIFFSISHIKDFSVATVVLERYLLAKKNWLIICKFISKLLR